MDSSSKGFSEFIVQQNIQGNMGKLDLDFTKRNFPIDGAAELVNILSLEIPREDSQIEFKQTMLPKNWSLIKKIKKNMTIAWLHRKF